MFVVFSSPPVFEVLHAAQAAEPAVDHDGHPGAERFAFLHAAQRRTKRHVGVDGVRITPPPPSAEHTGSYLTCET